MRPVLEIVDSNGVRYQTCVWASAPPVVPFNLPRVNNIPGTSYIHANYYSVQVPESKAAPVTFFIRVSVKRGDARPDFIYTLSVFGANRKPARNNRSARLRILLNCP